MSEKDEKEMAEVMELTEVMEVPPAGYVQIWRKVKDLFSIIKYWFVKPPKSNYVLHAERELVALGYDLNEKKDDPNRWIQQNIFELLEVFGQQGHSGSSAPYCVHLFSKLALFEPVCPLTGEDNEWHEYSDGKFQNIRCSRVFKDGKLGQAYDGEGKVFRDPDGSCYTSSDSRVFITFPYTPKREYVDRPAEDTV